MRDIKPQHRSRSRVLDDRGRPIRARAAGWGPARTHSDELTRARSREVERSFSRTGAPIVRATFFALLLATPFFMLPAIVSPYLVRWLQSTGNLVWLIPLSALLGIIGPLVMMLTLRRLMLPRLVRAYVDYGFCGSCGFVIRDLKPEADGCRVCPECGSAWRLDNPA